MRASGLPALLAAAGLAISVVAAAAEASPAAEEAIAILKEKGAPETIVCEVTPEWVTCTGVRTGICLAAGWLISHDATICRKRIG